MTLETGTIGAVSLALDAAALRHQALASNIANAATPGYQPLRVSFEEQLEAMRASLRAGRLEPSLLATIQPKLEREALVEGSPGGTQVALDSQVAKISENAVHYQALLRALNKQFAILGAAINDGKR
jgi:flagellar basal-body rod protein FlgB